jgi:hypothetical protein
MLDVMTAIDHAQKRPPVIGTASVLLPCIAFVLHCASSKELASGAFALWIVSLPFGILLATIAWARQERYGFLPWIGVLLSLGPLAFFIALLLSQ